MPLQIRRSVGSGFALPPLPADINVINIRLRTILHNLSSTPILLKKPINYRTAFSTNKIPESLNSQGFYYTISTLSTFVLPSDKSILSVRILTVIQHTCGAVEFKVLNAEVLQCIEDSLAVVRIVLLDKNVAVESAHFGDSKYADSAE